MAWRDLFRRTTLMRAFASGQSAQFTGSLSAPLWAERRRATTRRRSDLARPGSRRTQTHRIIA
jgi:hypothetical protein